MGNLQPPEGAELFTVDSQDGRLAFLGLYGVAGTVATLALVRGLLILPVLVAGAAIGGGLAWRLYGYHHVWLEADVLVSSSPRRTWRLALIDVTSVDASSIPAERLTLRGPGGEVDLLITPGSDALRHELGRRLRANHSRSLNHASPSVRRALDLG